MTQRPGGCQCGQLRYRLSAEPKVVVACHCTECQRQSASAFGISVVVDASAFAITRGRVAHFDRPAQRAGKMRGFFCPSCGVRIYHQRQSGGPTLNIKGGTFDDTAWLNPSLHIWLRSKQPWVRVPDGVQRFDTEPNF